MSWIRGRQEAERRVSPAWLASWEKVSPTVLWCKRVPAVETNSAGLSGRRRSSSRSPV
jgi:hypothetical protein